ncbi:hypothetical protein ACQP1K_04915 [Sphaerimonospora sp. CA-214678]|uniref:hypothetical protein n=1 Tax=Sphaerimonospora sp. CA-214678 TaxID=3240029 RepID=UPI003D94395C
MNNEEPVCGQLAARLHQEADAFTRHTSTDPLPPAPVVLGHACRAFTIAAAAARLLDEHAIPHRDAYAVCADDCGHAVLALNEILGPHLVRRYTGGTVLRADITALRQKGEEELDLSTIEDTDHITAAMVTLGAALTKALTPMATDENLPPMMREAARMAADAADILWSHFGGDSGGW